MRGPPLEEPELRTRTAVRRIRLNNKSEGSFGVPLPFQGANNWISNSGRYWG
jgi:hypothetical protein